MEKTERDTKAHYKTRRMMFAFDSLPCSKMSDQIFLNENQTSQDWNVGINQHLFPCGKLFVTRKTTAEKEKKPKPHTLIFSCNKFNGFDSTAPTP